VRENIEIVEHEKSSEYPIRSTSGLKMKLLKLNKHKPWTDGGEECLSRDFVKDACHFEISA
jgi:hypothetical protein